MGNFEKSYALGNAMRMKFPEGACVLADADEMAGLPAASASGATAGMRQVVLALDEPIPAEVIASASIIVLQADPSSAPSMRRIVELRSARPFMPLIVALRDADLATTRSLIREGVNDVVSLPFDVDQLYDALLNASIGAEHPGQELPVGPMCSIIGSTGGCGATTIVTHLAAELAARSKAGCCLVDLDVQFGAAATYLGLSHQHSVADLLEARTRLDRELLLSVADECREGMHVITAPAEILPLEEVDADQVLKVIKCARQNFDQVLLDLPTNITNWSLSAVLDSSLVLMVVELTIPSLRQARRRMDLLCEMGFDRRKIRTIVNRVERRLFKTIRLDDAETALKVPVIASIVHEPALVSEAQNQGVLVGDLQAHNAFSKDIGKLADALASVEVEG